jgi:uncharacterized protein DUF6088
MKTTQSTSEKILTRLKSRKGQGVPISDFLDLGNRPAVRQALSRLVRRGAIRRVRRGLYEIPQMGKLLNQPRVQSPDELVRAWARKNGLRVVPAGAQAANLLGLSTQVPAKITYYTNGRTRTLTLGPYSVKLLNRGPKTMGVRGRTAPLVFQALRYLGREGVTQEVVDRLRSTLSERDKDELRRNLRYAVAWMEPVIDEITNEEPD